jgi:hypothetical protein
MLIADENGTARPVAAADLEAELRAYTKSR